MKNFSGDINIVTGSAGFIGSELVAQLLTNEKNIVIGIDSLTYAGNLELFPKSNPKFFFRRIDICDTKKLRKLFQEIRKSNPKSAIRIYNSAAETHVDRSIINPPIFFQTNIIGTSNLLELAREMDIERFLQISTDEVYGSIENGSFDESSTLNPSSPYAASKASADLLVKSYVKTFDLDCVITRCANNYGENQVPEKLIPRMVTKAVMNQPLPIYGNGMNEREWIHVGDHVSALVRVMHYGAKGSIYNIGSSHGLSNLEIAQNIIKILKSDSKILFVEDRQGHDFRYSINAQKIHKELNWNPKIDFDSNFESCVLAIADKYKSDKAYNYLKEIEKIYE